MIEIFLAGLAFGLLMGIILTKMHMETKQEELEAWIHDQNELIELQSRFIEQKHKEDKENG